MLISQVIYLKLKNGNPFQINGQHIHGLFFKEILASYDPKLADRLHASDYPKCFSVSYIFREGKMFWFRIASWDDEIAESVFLYFRSHFEIKLGNCVFELIKTVTGPDTTPWAKRIKLNDFINNAKSADKNTFMVEHFSPTSFKCGDVHVPLPVPDLTVNSIIKHLPAKITAEIEPDKQELCNMIQLKEHRIKSVYNRKNYGSIASFVGKTRWQIDKRASQQERDAIRILFNFAFYSGIGVKTTQGMGMCRIIE